MKKIILITVIICSISCSTKQKGVFHATEKYFDSLPIDFKVKIDSAIKSSISYVSYNEYYKDKKVSFYVSKSNYWRFKENDSIVPTYKVIFSYDTVKPGPLWLSEIFIDSTTLNITLGQTN
ncbi:MAG: hypothetical protein KA161_12180 [Saprospiraceae bacterium]|nr:hypothetical protein [Saprospiraceae bacterium]